MAFRRGQHWNGLVTETCCQCGTDFAMSEELYHTARARREGFDFYCPNGHHQHYVTGQTEEEKLRQQRDRLIQRQAQLEDDANRERDRANREERRARAYKGQATKLRNRARAGVCPCCNRHFTNLERHMKGQHPDFASEPDEVS